MKLFTPYLVPCSSPGARSSNPQGARPVDQCSCPWATSGRMLRPSWRRCVHLRCPPPVHSCSGGDRRRRLCTSNLYSAAPTKMANNNPELIWLILKWIWFHRIDCWVNRSISLEKIEHVFRYLWEKRLSLRDLIWSAFIKCYYFDSIQCPSFHWIFRNFSKTIKKIYWFEEITKLNQV